MRRSDIAARIGGDEFVVVATHIPYRQEAERIGSLLREHLSRPIRSDATVFTCGASLGLAVFPNDGDDVSDLLKHADQEMYGEKSARRDSRAYAVR